MTRIIGLTGGIGSGKTTIANYFKNLGVPVYIADEQARRISNTSKILKSIKAVFGNKVFEENVLDRSKLSKIVFENPDKLNQLNAIIHPAVKKHFEKWVLKHAESPYIIKEAAILFESGSFKDCDFVITVIAPLEDRINRVILRDNITREEVLIRINNQWTDDERIGKSQFVIENSNLDQAKEQAKRILKKLVIL